MSEKKQPLTITLSTPSVIRTIVLIVASVLIFRFIGIVGHQLELIGIAAFLAVGLNPAVVWISKRLKSRSRVRATGVAYLIVVTILVSFVLLVMPPLVRQTSDFIQQVPTIISDFKAKDTSLARAVRRYKLDKQLDKLGSDFQNKVSNNVGILSTSVFTAVGRIGSTFISVLTVFVLTFMMLIEGPIWLKRLWALQPSAKREHRQKLTHDMYRVVTGYVNGQVVIATIAAGFALVAMLILSSLFHAHINAVALAGIVFLFGLIPLIGNTLAALVVALACLFVSVPLAIAMIIYFLVYQQIENVTLQPLIQAKHNQLTPLLVFTAALIGAGFGGLLGAFVAIPLAGCLKILLKDYLARRGAGTEVLSENGSINGAK